MTTMSNEDPADQSVHEQRELPEPAAWIDNVDLRGTLPDDGWCVVHSAPCDPCCEHNAYEPLYTADQMREAIAAERERSHELLQAADHIRAVLEAELAALRASAASVQADQRAEIDAANAVLDELRADAERYRWLRDHSSPESCLYYLCSDRTQARFNDPSWVDRHIATDIANNEAKVRAKSA